MSVPLFVTRMISRTAPREGENGPGTSPPPPPPVSPPPPPVSPPPSPPAAGDIVFTPEQQTKVNALLAEERRKLGEKNKTIVSELETLKQNKNLSDQEKTALQTRIDELTLTYTTKEQQAQTEIQKLQKKYDTDLGAKTKVAEEWETRFRNKLKTIDLRAAAEKHKALRSEQVEKLLWDNSVVEEVLDSDGKPTGEFATFVNFMGRDKEQKPVKLKLSAMDAVKAMTEMPDEYGNLFENSAIPGVGAQPNQGGAGSGGVGNIEQLTPAQWKANREKIRAQMGKIQ